MRKIFAGIFAVLAAGALMVGCEQPGGLKVSDSPDTTPEAEPVGYAAAANGANGKQNSTALVFTFDKDITGLKAEDISLAGGTGDNGGSVDKGALDGSGREWTLGIAVIKAGTVTVSINKTGIDAGEKPVTVYRAGEMAVISYSVKADGGSGKSSSAVNFTFGAAVANLEPEEITVTGDTGNVTRGALTGAGQNWSLAINVQEAGDIRIAVRREGIEDGEKTVTVYREAEEAPAFDPEEPAEPEKTGIAIVSPPDITVYGRGQTFDTAGLLVAWVYSDGTRELMTASEYTLTQPNMTEFNPKQITVSAGSFTASFNIQVLDTDKVLSSISVKGEYKKVQDLGLPFDRTGLVVTGRYSDNSTRTLTNYAAITGYDPLKRGPQEAGVKVNGKTAPLGSVTTRIGDAAAVSINAPKWAGLTNQEKSAYKSVYFKGEAVTPENCNIRLTVKPGGGALPVTLSCTNGNITEEDIAGISGYDSGLPGKQTPGLTLDGRSFDLNVIVIDTEPDVWFDYGYMRHSGDPEGAGKGAGIGEGKYHAKPGETVILAPVRYLVGYNADHSDAAGTSYAWTVSGGSYTTSRGGEFLHFTPGAAGTYNIAVSVTGRSYVTGGDITKTASTKVVCFDNNPSPKTSNLILKNFGPGQMAEKGSTGYGWSLGCAGGYQVFGVEHKAGYTIKGNAFAGWCEPGIVWIQEDRNGNGLPDETWYELKGGDEDDPAWKGKITRRYAVRYFNAGGGGAVNEYGQTLREVYWTDSKGRGGYLPGGWPSDFGVTGNWVTYTLTLLRDNGNIDTGAYGYYPMYGYVDAVAETFYIKDAMDITGSSVNLQAVRFLKVQTSVFHYGGSFGDVSTEIGG
jgi:hypothetical protein